MSGEASADLDVLVAKHASLTSTFPPFINYSLHVMTKRIPSVYEEHAPKIEVDKTEKKISKLIRLLTFAKTQEETNKIIKDIQYYQNLAFKINSKQPSLFD